jgi:hypothetical protein
MADMTTTCAVLGGRGGRQQHLQEEGASVFRQVQRHQARVVRCAHSPTRGLARGPEPSGPAGPCQMWLHLVVLRFWHLCLPLTFPLGSQGWELLGRIPHLTLVREGSLLEDTVPGPC